MAWPGPEYPSPLLDKNEKGLKKVEAKLKKVQPKVISFPLDVTDKAQHQQALKEVLNTFKKVDILINGAGINAPTPILDISSEEWHAIIDSHTTATLFGCQVFGAAMLKRRKGSIINMSSASAGPPLSKAFTYSVAKAGVRNLTQNLGREWAPYHVRVNALRPDFSRRNGVKNISLIKNAMTRSWVTRPWAATANRTNWWARSCGWLQTRLDL